MANDTVARNRDGQRVGSAGLRHGSHGRRCADTLGDFGVAHALALRNAAQRLPHALLESRAADVQRQIEADTGRLDETDDHRHPLLELGITADELRVGKPVLQLAGQCLRVVAQRDGADTAIALCDQDGTQGALPDGESNVDVGTARTEAGGRHPEHRVGLLVEPAAGVVARLVDGRGDGPAARQRLADTSGPVAGRVGFRCQAGDRLEDPVQVGGAHPGALRQLLKRRHLFGCFDEAAQFSHHPGLLDVACRLVGAATQAGPKPGLLGFGGCVVERHVRRFRGARCAARPAIDGRGPHGVEEPSVGLTVAPDDGSPSGVANDRRFSLLCFAAVHGGTPVGPRCMAL